MSPPLPAFGPGAGHDFPHYLEGTSRVAVKSPDEVARWLLECRYADDAALLDEHDYWQHPCTFEVVRSGDCEDYSLWAWRKLVEARYDADFVVGMHRRVDGVEGRHAWVVFRDAESEYVLDGVQRTVEAMIRLRSDAAGAYTPQVGASAIGRRFAYAGLYRTDWGRRVRLVAHDR
ncbi:MAG: transglutaminase-like cysteine peptidase [Gemmatimonadaceae bacterium]|nr:transglutaminase-like cysteine peptidase [Gemmatimonadaceae bacterium]